MRPSQQTCRDDMGTHPEAWPFPLTLKVLPGLPPSEQGSRSRGHGAELGPAPLPRRCRARILSYGVNSAGLPGWRPQTPGSRCGELLESTDGSHDKSYRRKASNKITVRRGREVSHSTGVRCRFPAGHSSGSFMNSRAKPGTLPFPQTARLILMQMESAFDPG